MKNYDVVAKSWKGETIFKGITKNGIDWIRRHWKSDEFATYDLRNAAVHVKNMNDDGLSVIAHFGV